MKTPSGSVLKTSGLQNRIPLSTTLGKVRRLGIHGARGTGKTCFLACLYGHRATQKAAVTFNDDHSIDHLQRAWTVLERGDVPDATALTLPTELSLSLQADGLTWHIPTRDYAGALVQRSETGVPELKREVKEWLGACHAILLFVNCDADDAALRERHNELDLLITELKRLSPDGNTISRPLAFLLTKWDIQGGISGDFDGERQRALEYLHSRPALKQIGDSLRLCGDRVAIFPVSAFGANRNNTQPPATGPRPFGLLEPLVWIAHKSDEMLLERARREALQHAGPQLWWWQRHYGRAVSCFRNLEREQGINKGPTYEKARSEMSHWRNKLYRRRAWQIGLVATVAWIAIAGSLLWEERNSRERALAALDDSSLHPDDVHQACNQYLTSLNPLTQWFGWRDDIARQQTEYREQREKRELEALEEYRRTNLADEAADKRFERCRDFLQRWPSSRYAPIVRGWQIDDQVRAQAYQDCLRFDERYRQLLAKLQGIGDDFDRAIAECNMFLAEFPEVRFPNRRIQRQEIEQCLAAYENAKREKDWAVVVSYERQNPKNFDEIIRRAQEYANKPGAAYRNEALQTIERTQIRWDRAEYEKVCMATREAKDCDSIQAAEHIARRYLNGSHPLKRCEEDVRRWLKWCDDLKEERDYYIEVKTISIPDGSDLDEVFVTEEPRVHIDLNGIRHTTAWYRGQTPQIGERLGPFRLKWGQGGVLKVEVEEYDITDFNDWARGEATDQCFVLLKAHGVFTTVCSNNKEVLVYLECPAVVPPSLEPYPDK
ncbi:MAG: hypothetical protein NZ700_04515 [Gemmataceae bacterium]|nr:hypothetical protein [Gemmataceae bacterium]MDW8266484.1 hypothetical protein [Gemmataceae bacterium]